MEVIRGNLITKCCTCTSLRDVNDPVHRCWLQSDHFFFSRTQLAFSKLVISAYFRHLSSTECVQLKTFYALLTAFVEGEYLFTCNRHLSSIENTASSSSSTNTQICTFQIYQWTCTVRTMKKKRLEHGSTR